METEEVMPHEEVSSDSNLTDASWKIIEALDGKENIETVTACATRLRVAVKEGDAVKKGDSNAN